MNSLLSDNIEDDEFLYRGVVDVNWDFENNRPSSAAFKDSKGASVDRKGERTEDSVVQMLVEIKPFKAIIRITAKEVRDENAIVLYKPIIPDNIYHSEIHDSHEEAQLRGKKPAKLRDKAFQVYVRI